MNAWVIFRRARIVLFSFLVLLSLTWATLFAVFLAHEWSYFSQSQKIVVVSLLSLYGFTAILLYLMAVLQFRLWWDVARAVSLLVIHAGSSVVFTLYRSSFPCRGFDTEAICEDFVSVILIGCWVFSVMILCFSIVLGIMAFLPRPVDSLSGSGEAEFPSIPASFKSGSRPPSFHSFDPRMGLSPYDDKSEFPDVSLFPARTLVVANRASPRLGKSFQSERVRNRTDDPISPKTMINGTDSPVNVKSRRWQPDSLNLNLFSAPSSPLLPVYSPASETGNESPSISLSMPRRLPTVPKVMYGPRAMTSDSMHHDRATPYTPTSYIDPSVHSFKFPATLRESHQPRHLYSDLVQTATPGVNSFRSATVSIHSTWAPSHSQNLPPPALTPGVAHSSHFLRRTDPPSTYHAQNTTFKRNFSEADAAVHGGGLGRRSYTLPATEIQRRGSDGQVVDHAEWRRLVLGAAAKP